MLIYMQKINFITIFYFKILQSNSKLVIWGNFDMPGHTQLWWYLFEVNLDVYLKAKSQLHPLCSPWDIAKALQIHCFGYFGHAWLSTFKVVLSTCRKLSCLSAGKTSTPHPTFFFETLQIYANSYFGNFGHTRLRTPNKIPSTCRKLLCLSGCQK